MAVIGMVAMKAFAAVKAVMASKVAVTAVQAGLALNKGAQVRKQKVQEANALEDAAGRKMAATTAKMEEDARLKAHMESRALAVAAAGGGGVDDPTMVNLIGDLNAEGEYRIMSRLYVGQDEATGLREQAYAARREGDAALQAGYVGAATTVMSHLVKNPFTKKGPVGPTGVSSQGLPQSPSANPPPTTIWN